MDSTAFTPSGKKSIEGENIEANSEGYANDHIHHLQQQHHQMCIHEVMEILPKLQFGLDINPKFTSGPDSFEVRYTKDHYGIFLILNVCWLLYLPQEIT